MDKIFGLLAFLLVSSAVIPSSAFAEGSGAAGFGGLMPLILIFVFFYLFLLRPQQKKAKEHQQLLNALKRDDKVITAGGIHGTVVSINGNIAEVKIADGVNIQVDKASIAAVKMQQKEDEVKTPDVIKK